MTIAVPGGKRPSSKLKSAVGVGSTIVITVKRATRLVSVLLAAVAIRRKSVPESPSAKAGVVKLLLVAPVTFVKVDPPGPRACHWNVVRAGSLTVAEKVAVLPDNTT